MMPMPASFMSNETDAMIVFLEEQVILAKNFCAAFADCIGAMMPTHAEFQSQVDERAQRLSTTMSAWLTHGTVQQIERMRSAPSGSHYPGNAEALAWLVQQRNQVEEQLELFSSMKEKFSQVEGPGAAMADYVDAVRLPFQQQHDQLERQISELQRQLEKSMEGA